MADLLDAAKGSPFLLLALVVVGGLLYAVEHVLALSGPVTKLVTWWQGRELARIRREAAVRAERRRIEREEENAVMADLRAQVALLTEEVGRLRSVVRGAEADRRVMREWADGLLRAARAAGLVYVDPPTTGEQVAVSA